MQIREWKTFGLPSDKTSINNAILATIGMSYPLMIDP